MRCTVAVLFAQLLNLVESPSIGDECQPGSCSSVWERSTHHDDSVCQHLSPTHEPASSPCKAHAVSSSARAEACAYVCHPESVRLPHPLRHDSADQQHTLPPFHVAWLAACSPGRSRNDEGSGSRKGACRKRRTCARADQGHRGQVTRRKTSSRARKYRQLLATLTRGNSPNGPSFGPLGVVQPGKGCVGLTPSEAKRPCSPNRVALGRLDQGLDAT